MHIFSVVPALRELLLASNERYLAFLADLTDTSGGLREIEHLGESVKRDEQTYRGFNLFRPDDLDALRALLRGEGMISGITNKMLRQRCPGKILVTDH